MDDPNDYYTNPEEPVAEYPQNPDPSVSPYAGHDQPQATYPHTGGAGEQQNPNEESSGEEESGREEGAGDGPNQGGKKQPRKQSATKKLAEEGKKRVVENLAGAAGDAVGGPIVGELAKIAVDKEKRKKAIIVLCIILGIILFIFGIFFSVLFGGGGASEQQQQQNNGQTNPLTISKTGPDKVGNTGTYAYTITLAFPNSAQDIIIVDTLDKNAKFIDSDWKKYTLGTDATGNTTITWHLMDNKTAAATTTPGATQPVPGGLIAGPINETFTFTVQPLVADNYVYNISTTATTVGATNGGNADVGYVAPTTDNCLGKSQDYTNDLAKLTKNGLPAKNFGDPKCDFTKDALFALLSQQEGDANPTKSKEFATIWFSTIIIGESSYNPNIWAPPVGQQAALDGGGAWGLAQMGSSTPPFLPPPAKGQNGIYDRGDLNWQLQTDNAIKYNVGLHCSFWYWRTYRVYYIGSHPTTKCKVTDSTCVEAQQC